MSSVPVEKALAGTLWLYARGFTPFVAPWLKLPEETYYLIEAFYILPLCFLMWIMGTGVLRILGRIFGGTGRFETLLTMTGYSLWAPWYPLIVVDCLHSTPEWLYNTVLAACIVLLPIETAIAVKVEEKIRWPAAVVCAVVSVGSVGVITFTYIR